MIGYNTMFVTTHVAIGAIVGATFPSRTLAFALGFASHFLVDMIPHGDEHMLDAYKSGSKVRSAIAYVTVDAVAAIYILMLILGSTPEAVSPYVKWGIAGSVLPDVFVAVYEATKFKPFFRKFASWHHKNHHQLIGKFRKGRDISFKWGVAYQVLAAIFLMRIVL